MKSTTEEVALRSVADLFGKNVVVYDLEIKKKIEDCSNGWDSHDEMGISVGCAFDYRASRYRVFMDDNVEELVERLNEPGTLVVAFNHLNFDNKLLRATCKTALKPDAELRNYDMMVESKAGAGAAAGNYHKGFRLDDHLKALGLPMKTGDGASAPIWWQEGKVGKVIDYCMNDVTQERALFEHMYVHGKAACAYKSEPYEVPLPEIA